MKSLFEKGLETSHDKIQAFGSALVKVACHIPWSDNCVGICGRNSPEWFIAQHACAAYGFPIVPIYATLGDEAIEHILKLTELRVVVCDSGEEICHILEKSSSLINLVIVVNDGPKVAEAKVRFSSNVKIYLFDEFLAIGFKYHIPKTDPKPDDLYMICFTSGSTGLPKGVMIEHQQIVDAVFGIIENTEEKCCNKLSTHLSYLPFAHIMEQVNSSVVILEGAKIGFLTSTVDGLLADCESLKPTVLTTVPRVLSRIYTKYYEAIEGSALKTRLVNHVIKQKLGEQKRGKFNHQSLLDTLCFKKLRQALGGRICGIITGGAPLMPEITQFMRAVFNGLIVEGFGCTETMGVVTVSLVGEFRIGALGAVAYGVEVKLADVLDLGLVVKRDNRGEEGSLMLVDRVKSIFKLAQGEYVAPERLEALYQSCSLISQIFIDANPKSTYPVAIIVPNFDELRESLSKTDPGLVNLSDHDLCQHEIIHRKYLNVLDQIANQRFLKGFEKLKKIHLTDETFTIENGLLTPTLKISRYKARKVYSEIINRLCDEIMSTENHK
ncbi:long-chain-fatty-acid--CoA ligase [Schistosoma mansoni]|uniref:long-chain-fatty-acid--CoA ligase n=1 Tax=Schistosoma mansoni TaxID=6183 RepID=UPI00022DCB9A|nr:long-chain-fatty-acid--CoA ligase [Schistosoma mansoni]|eukprot:XP_018654234.1 long-chain-fatty-acid--CoA ligase [Schistosoma mansoni]